MQLWGFKKCREEAVNGGFLAADSYIKIVKIRRLGLITACAALIMLAALVMFCVLHSEEAQWDDIQTHEIQEFVLSADDCIEYSMDMNDGDCVKSTIVMPSKAFTLETDVGGNAQQSVYYVFLDPEGREGIFCFENDMSQEVSDWLAAWENVADETPEPVEIFGLRGELSIIATDAETRRIAEDYDGKSYIDVGAHLVVREVEIPGAVEALARQEEEQRNFEEQRQSYLVGIYTVIVLLAVTIAAIGEGVRIYGKARLAFMTEIEPED